MLFPCTPQCVPYPGSDPSLTCEASWGVAPVSPWGRWHLQPMRLSLSWDRPRLAQGHVPLTGILWPSYLPSCPWVPCVWGDEPLITTQTNTVLPKYFMLGEWRSNKPLELSYCLMVSASVCCSFVVQLWIRHLLGVYYGASYTGWVEKGDDMHFFNGCEILPKTWLRKGLKKGTQMSVFFQSMLEIKKDERDRTVLGEGYCLGTWDIWVQLEYLENFTVWKQSVVSASWNKPPGGRGTG